MSAAQLDVYLYGQAVGVLTSIAPDSMRLAYDADYFSRRTRPLLSISLGAPTLSGAAVRNWFANLLPEGDARTFAAGTAGVPAHDDFALLAALGRECAGAVELWPRGEARPPSSGVIEFETFLMEQIESWIAAPRRRALGTSAPPRLSLAGAQFKTAVLQFDDGTLAVPTNGAASSHILKIPNSDLPGIVTLEALGMRLAAAIGLPAAEVSLVATSSPCLLVTRYDRRKLGDGHYERIHQEDICQSLGVAPEHKYEEHGGPGFAEVFGQLRQWGSEPTRLTRLLQWSVFNAVIGNADAHGKNLSVLHHHDGTVDLAPAYDLVPSGLIADVDRRLAMRLGHATTIDNITSADWDSLANAIGISRRLTRRTVAQVSGRILEEIGTVCTRLAEEGASAGLLQHAESAIATRARAIEAGTPLPPATVPRAAPVAWG